MFSVFLFSATILLANRASGLAIPRNELNVQKPLLPLPLSQTPIIEPAPSQSSAASTSSTPISSKDDRSTFQIVPAPDYTAYLTSTDLEHKSLLRVQLLQEMSKDWLYSTLEGEPVAEITYAEKMCKHHQTAGTIKLGTPFAEIDSLASENKGGEMMFFDTARPGMDMEVAGVEIDGKMEGQTEETRLTARLDLTNPYTVLPTEAFERLLLATHAEEISTGVDSESEHVVDCSRMKMYPQVAVRFDGEKELVLEPKQYVLEVKNTAGWNGMDGKCVLAVKGMEDGHKQGDVVVGWAGLRGRKVVLDWRKGRTGIQA
ncbi:hypothetical protein P154DRAFT_564932 [Amniculicola lignicola CBS 123094]|uniref:Peptidase A1 domain-containing protein n=1 Tax=Amniculicola lignicola CBS 123094 TaxID=1392246 RepID=A0A6A5WG82_9PLEO|nr:hypothetical protein P154DRAFT_564932 [Amniculicola lignicola CBS 123094]